MAMTETIAVRYRFAEIFNIAGPSCAPGAAQKTLDNRSRPTAAAVTIDCLSQGTPPGFEAA
jgi:hypothetical protein